MLCHALPRVLANVAKARIYIVQVWRKNGESDTVDSDVDAAVAKLTANDAGEHIRAVFVTGEGKKFLAKAKAHALRRAIDKGVC